MNKFYNLCAFFFLLFAHKAFPQSTIESLHVQMDNWHLAASQANGAAFFGFMSSNSVYIGTDSWEHWTKDEFMAFAKPYFDRGKAWDFKPIERKLYLSADGKTAWFSELLDTWMGVCRGSGVLVKEKGGWKLAHYHLAVTVPNEEIQPFITLVKGKQKIEKPE